MIVGCTLPLLLILLAPVFGIRGNASVVLFVLVMFACHLLMPHYSGRHHHEGTETSKPIRHETH